MTKSTLYSMGTFTEIDSPFDLCNEKDYQKQLEEIGYDYKPEMTIPSCIEDYDFVFFTLHRWNGDKEKEPTYPFYANIEMNCCDGRALFFDSWISVMHFLQNYTGWMRNIMEMEK